MRSPAPSASRSFAGSSSPARRNCGRVIAKLPSRSSACVAKRGDVLVARRKLGFGVEGKREHFVVVQSDLLSGLDTLVVAPLFDDGTVSRGDPLSVQVHAAE